MGSNIRRWVHNAICAALIGLFVMDLTKSETDLRVAALVAIGVAGGAIGYTLMTRAPRFHDFVRYAAVAPPIFAILMVGFSP